MLLAVLLLEKQLTYGDYISMSKHPFNVYDALCLVILHRHPQIPPDILYAMKWRSFEKTGQNMENHHENIMEKTRREVEHVKSLQVLTYSPTISITEGRSSTTI